MDFDALPLRIVDDLQKHFPKIEFKVKDPNEEWEVLQDLIVIDTVQGIEQVKVFDDLEQFKSSPRTSLHDFDALFNLQHLKKLGKLDKIKIIGIPPTISKQKAIQEVRAILASLL